MTTFVIVGGGLAGAKAAETLRAEGFDGEVVLFGSEPERPYERPPLAKGYLLGKDTRDSVFVHPADWYAEHDVDLRTGVTVAMIDPAAHLVTFDGGTIGLRQAAAHDRRVARAASTFPGRASATCFYLRTLPESDALRAAFTPEARVVIVGAGWIGLEAAAAARTAGSSVTIVEPQPGALHRVLGPELGGKFADLHRAHGVEFRFEESAAEFLAAGPGSAKVGSVVTTAGAELPADVVVVGIGVVPNDGLAKSAGLDVDNGVVTDSALRTSDPDIFAAGDVASSYHAAARPPPAHGPLVERAQRRQGGRRSRCSASRSSTTGCRTSTATSTTSAWNARACPRPARTTRSSTAATATRWSSSPSGSTRAGWSRA